MYATRLSEGKRLPKQTTARSAQLSLQPIRDARLSRFIQARNALKCLPGLFHFQLSAFFLSHFPISDAHTSLKLTRGNRESNSDA